MDPFRFGLVDSKLDLLGPEPFGPVHTPAFPTHRRHGQGPLHHPYHRIGFQIHLVHLGRTVSQAVHPGFVNRRTARVVLLKGVSPAVFSGGISVQKRTTRPVQGTSRTIQGELAQKQDAGTPGPKVYARDSRQEAWHHVCSSAQRAGRRFAQGQATSGSHQSVSRRSSPKGHGGSPPLW
jgi:hypothetical protein